VESRSPSVSRLCLVGDKELPFHDVVGIADGFAGREFLGRAGRAQEFEAGFVREAVAFAGIHVFAGPDEVFPGVTAAAGTREDVVQAAFIRAQLSAGVLAAVAVALADGAGAEFWAFLGHLGVVQCHDDSWHANGTTHGLHGGVVRANGQGEPFFPGHRAKCFRAGSFRTGIIAELDVEGGGDVGGHLAEGILRRAYVDGLPVAVEDEDGGFVQYVHSV
jgi:hypothetical protein